MLTGANTQSTAPPESLQTLDKLAQVARGNCMSSQKKKQNSIKSCATKLRAEMKFFAV